MTPPHRTPAAACHHQHATRRLFQTVFDPMFIAVYNLFYTSMPVLALAVFDQDVKERQSLTYPKLYTPGLRDLFFNKWEFAKAATYGFITSLVIFIVPYGEEGRQAERRVVLRRDPVT